MKNFIITILFFFCSFNGASATSLHPDTFLQVADLVTWDFDVDSHLRNLDVTGGKVAVNPVSKVASVTLNLADNCPVNAYCLVYIPEFKIELPITNISKDRCGVITYVAEKNMMPVDGAYKKLVIKDTSFSICEMFYAAATMISYEETFVNRIEHRTEKHYSRMTAEKLESAFSR
ncbi:MAG: hypothetical protein HYV97_04850 [Bdellovibrio sp.]|nr:hypothetical protein [Bdellovibrio sp.]